jgi:hypothetical protein
LDFEWPWWFGYASRLGCWFLFLLLRRGCTFPSFPSDSVL